MVEAVVVHRKEMTNHSSHHLVRNPWDNGAGRRAGGNQRQKTKVQRQKERMIFSK